MSRAYTPERRKKQNGKAFQFALTNYTIGMSSLLFWRNCNTGARALAFR
jgi:hypothetical protein